MLTTMILFLRLFGKVTPPEKVTLVITLSLVCKKNEKYLLLRI